MTASLLPPNATRMERATEAATARIGDVPAPVANVWHVDDCPAGLLPYLAWALSVDDWSEDWPERVKRNVIRASIAVHRQKGTIGAIHKALEAMDLDLIDVIEWWERTPAGEPYTFDVEIGLLSRGLSPEEHTAIRAAVAKARNLRSHLANLKLYLQVVSPAPSLAAATTRGRALTVYPYKLTELEQVGAAPFLAAAVHDVRTVTVYPGA